MRTAGKQLKRYGVKFTVSPLGSVGVSPAEYARYLRMPREPDRPSLLKRLSKPSILAFCALLAGCGVPHSPIHLPPRPVLIEWSEGLLERTPLEAADLCSANDLSMKEYALRLESRIRLHNELMK